MARDSGESDAAGIIILAFGVGALVGAAAAALVTAVPRSGSRRLLSVPGGEHREGAAHIVRSGGDFVHRRRRQLSSALGRGREAYRRALDSDRSGVDVSTPSTQHF